MAFALKLLLILGKDGGHRVVKVEQTASGQPGAGAAAEWWLRGRLTHDYSDEEMRLDLEELTGYTWDVTSFAEPFELRRAQVLFTVQDAAIAQDDIRVVTFDFLKLAAGVPDATWEAANFTTTTDAIVAMWTAIRDRFDNDVTLDRIKYYKLGPDIEPPQLPVNESDWNISGSAAGTSLPPQCAISVTEKAGSKRHWGRFYLPSPSSLALGLFGRIEAAALTDIADAVDTMYQTCKTANIPVVVYRRPLDVRQTAQEKREGVEPGSLPARPGTAWTVDDIQVDDVFDVIRSRRWKYPTLRVQRAVS